MLVRKRRGVALLITLSVIASMLALVGVMFAYIETARKEAGTKASVLQANLLRDDLQRHFQTLLGKKPDKDSYRQLYGTAATLGEREGTFRLSLSCSPLLNRIRLSWLGWEGNEKNRRYYTVAKDLFDELCDRAEIREPHNLYRMIVDRLEGKRERYGIRTRLQGKKGIISSKEFRGLLDEYRYQADDPNVYNIAWERYFTFVNPPGISPGIDGDFIQPEVLALLYGLEVEEVRQAYKPGDLGRTLEELGEEKRRYGWLFLKQPSGATECEMTFTFMERERKGHLNYIANRIEDFQLEN